MLPYGIKKAFQKGGVSMSEFKHAASNIRLLLSYKGWTQEVLSKKSGISIATLKRRLKTNEGWTLSEAVLIGKTFGVSASELFFTRMVPNGTKIA